MKTAAKAIAEVKVCAHRFSASVEAFHDANTCCLAETPLCMISTVTHDTKRGEDIRAIIGASADHARY